MAHDRFIRTHGAIKRRKLPICRHSSNASDKTTTWSRESGSLLTIKNVKT